MVSQNNLIKQLNEAPSLRGFFALSVNLFSQNVDSLIQRVFRKDDFALESVVNSLFEHQGPLAELSVRLKVLVGLGAISTETFEDITAFIEFKQQLSDEIEEHQFSSKITLNFLQKIHHIDLSLILNLLEQIKIENKESMQYQMQQTRLNKMIHSSLILAITEISEELNIESPL